MSFADRNVTCVHCGMTFVFSGGEQQFFQEKGFVHEPKHCKQCKARSRKTIRRGRDDTHVICCECGIDTTVPFKPSQNRPVLCATCFSRKPKAADGTGLKTSNQLSNRVLV